MQFDDIRVSLTDAQKFDFVLSVDFLSERDDLHGEFFLSSTISTTTTDRITSFAKETFSIDQFVITKERTGLNRGVDRKDRLGKEERTLINRCSCDGSGR